MVDRPVAHSSVRIFGDHYAVAEICAAVAESQRRNCKLAEIRLWRIHLLTWRVFHDNRRNRILTEARAGRGEQFRNTTGADAEQRSYDFPVPPKPADHGMPAPLNPLEENHPLRTLELLGDAGQLMDRIDLAFHMDDLAAPFQHLYRAFEIHFIHPRFTRARWSAMLTHRLTASATADDDRRHVLACQCTPVLRFTVVDNLSAVIYPFPHAPLLP